MTDKYKTVHKDTIGEGFYSEKRSKFLAFVHHIESAEEALDVVRHYKKVLRCAALLLCLSFRS